MLEDIQIENYIHALQLYLADGYTRKQGKFTPAQIIKWLMCRTYAEVVNRNVYADLREMHHTGAISL